MTTQAADFDFLYGLFRMVLPIPREAESAAVRTLLACSRADVLPPSSAGRRARLVSAAVGELARRAAQRDVAFTREVKVGRVARHAQPTLSTAAVAAIPDRTLGALVRSLDLLERQAVVLSVMLGLDEAEVARALVCEPAAAAAFARSGLEHLARRLDEYAIETNKIGSRAALSAYHLRPIRQAPSDGVIVARGDRAYVAEAPNTGLLAMAMRIIERLLERLVRQHGPDMRLDSDVGEPGRAPRTRPTATGKRYRKPDPTPSLTEYRQPRSTPGIGNYRMPKMTPSTERISNRTSPLDRGRR